MTQISISLPETLVKLIDQMAAAENRNRSNYTANVFPQKAKAFEEEKIVPRFDWGNCEANGQL